MGRWRCGRPRRPLGGQDGDGSGHQGGQGWRSPADDRAHLPSSGILFSGRVDGAPVALVAADVPGESSSWLLQLTRDGDRYAVTRATEYTDPGYLVYSDVLPVQTAGGRRYLVSAGCRPPRPTGPDVDHRGRPERAGRRAVLPGCRSDRHPANHRVTARGRAADRLLDLGTGTVDPRYPLVRDESGTGRRALTGLDTCVLAGDRGPFGSIPRRIGDRDAPARCRRPGRWRSSRCARSVRSPSAVARPPSCSSSAGTPTPVR
ncbi:hypothetical protein NKG94_24195 [Micromonospora sp. M12]